MNAEGTIQVAREGSGEMFDRIAHRYDALNRILSFGNDQKWRRATVHALRTRSSGYILDCATGTGDLAMLLARSYPSVRVIGIDPSTEMLRLANAKIARAGLEQRVRVCPGQAEELPFPDQTFDGICIAFGIRNVPDRPKALTEMLRVLKPGARAAILELTEPTGSWLGPVARFQVRVVVPWLGGLLAGSREYRYLQRSIAQFPSPGTFLQMMTAAGFANSRKKRLTLGVCHLFVGERSPTL
jgi:demethylmenaquinone methyltransferase/2-methoxy-6-polyprenyl-1,4-benzoquinol methylase